MLQSLSSDDLKALNWLSQVKAPAFHWDLKQLQELSASHEFWGWIEQGRITAAVAIIRLPQAWEIPWLATRPDCQRQGQMRSLLSALFAAKQHDSEIWLEVHESNEPARNLYKSLGFAEVGRRPRYYSDGGAAILLTRSGPGSAPDSGT